MSDNRKKILIIEDDPDIAALEKDYLENDNFEVVIEGDGHKGMERALKEQFALILLDLMLPGKDGMTICREIREKVDIPILMVTARIEDIDKVRGLGLGADDYITKPFAPAELVARVKAHIARYTRFTETNEKLKTLSITDELTKLNNRRSFSEYMDLVWKQGHRLMLPINVLMIDVDYFKRYNDTLGHLEGDKALVSIARCLKNHVKRETDFAARFGGEEFVCLLPFIEKDEAFDFAKTLVTSVENMKIPHPMNEHSNYLTISAGMASIVPDNNNSQTQLLDEADKALYMAKETGRNKVVLK